MELDRGQCRLSREKESALKQHRPEIPELRPEGLGSAVARHNASILTVTSQGMLSAGRHNLTCRLICMCTSRLRRRRHSGYLGQSIRLHGYFETLPEIR